MKKVKKKTLIGLGIALAVAAAAFSFSGAQKEEQNSSAESETQIEETKTEKTQSRPVRKEKTEPAEDNTEEATTEENAEPCEADEPTEQSEAETVEFKQSEPDPQYSGYYGRLHIPDVGVSVGLYSDQTTGTDLQTIVDRKDSAAIYCGTPYSSCVVADHSNQDFSRLMFVTQGTTAYITLPDGNQINLKCVAVLNGYNIETGAPYDIVDENYNPVYGNYNMITYTCMSDYYNIRICGWTVV